MQAVDGVELTDVTIGAATYQWPKALVENVDVFMHVVSQASWDGLTDDQRNNLRKFLPPPQPPTSMLPPPNNENAPDQKPQSSPNAQLQTIVNQRVLDLGNVTRQLFDPDAVFIFAHPVRTFHRMLKDGSYNFVVPSDRVRLRDNARVLYDHQIRRYYLKLLRTLIANRRSMLEHASGQADPVVMNNGSDSDDTTVTQQTSTHTAPTTTSVNGGSHYDAYRLMQRRVRQHNIEHRASKRCRMMLSDVASSAGCPDVLSSDDDDLGHVSPKLSTVTDGVTTLTDDSWRDTQMYQPIAYADMHDMLLEHQALTSTDPEHPSLNTNGLSMAAIVERCGMTANALRVGLIKDGEA